ncbi:MAG: hypothetical protein H6779_00855 [Candidatus Nomurabacteria bacterium]|nr:hypothetical protein [Candidatus Nomurabacteria bacterium]USN87979.1 MAG: hypothetical protein H6779_00855 [Candidatus Nomurabacteria bacterium]
MRIESLSQKANKPGAEIVDAEIVEDVGENESNENSDTETVERSNGDNTVEQDSGVEVNTDPVDEPLEEPQIDEVELKLEIDAEKLPDDVGELKELLENSRQEFERIKEDAELLRDSIHLMNSHIVTANSVLMAIGNLLRESDQNLLKNHIENRLPRSFRLFNETISSISQLIEENKDKLDEIKEKREGINEEGNAQPEKNEDKYANLKNKIAGVFDNFNNGFLRLNFGGDLDSLPEPILNGLPETLVSKLKLLKQKEVEFNNLLNNSNSDVQNSRTFRDKLVELKYGLYDLIKKIKDENFKYKNRRTDASKSNGAEDQKEVADTKAEEVQDFAERKSEIVSEFSLVESKFENTVNKAKSVAKNTRSQIPTPTPTPTVRRFIEEGQNIVKEFNEVVKNEASEEVCNELEEKKVKLESVIASLSKKVGEMEEVESNDEIDGVQKTDNKENGGDGDADEKFEPKADEIPTLQEEIKLRDGVVDAEVGSEDDLSTESEGEVINIDKSTPDKLFDLEESDVATKKEAEFVDMDNEAVETLELSDKEKVELKTKDEKEIELTDYQKAKQDLLFSKVEGTDKTFKEAYQDNKKEYEDAVKNYYANRGGLGKIKDWGKKFLGLKPKLPDNIKVLEDKYKVSRKEYTRKLRLAMKERGKLSVNEEFHKSKLESETAAYLASYNKEKAPKPTGYEQKVDQAFLKKFVLRPGKERLDIQKTEILTEEQAKTVGRVMMKLKKTKWWVRGGIILGAGVLAGAAAAGVAGARMAISSGAALGADQVMSFKVRKAEAKAEKLMEGEDFSVDDIDNYEEEVMQALRKAKAAQSQRTAATIGAGFLAGGLTGYGMSHLGSADQISESVSKATDATSEQIAAALDKNPEILDMLGGEETSSATEAVAGNVGVTEVVDKITVPNYSFSHEQFSTLVKDLSVVGAEDLSGENLVQVESYLRLNTSNLLALHPNMTADNLSETLLGKLEGKFGETDWWQESPITKVEIGSIEKIDASDLASSATAEVNSTAENALNNEVAEAWREHAVDQTTSNVENVENIHTVVKGDTLWDIVEDRYQSELADLSPSERNQVLDALFDKVRADEVLRELANINDTELIYPGDKINLGPLEGELNKLIELEKNDIDLPTSPSSGHLEVVADGSSEEVIPITANHPDIQVSEIAERVEESPLIEFATKPGTSTPVTLAMNDYAQTVAAELVAKDPSIAPYELKAGVWQALTAEAARNPAWDIHSVLKFEVDQTNLNLPSVENVVSANIQPPETYNSDNFFHSPEYKDYALQVFGSEKNLNAAINEATNQVDAGAYDFFDARNHYDSFMSVYGNMTMKEFGDMQYLYDQYGRDYLIHALNNTAPESGQLHYLGRDTVPSSEVHNIKYEAAVAWMDAINNLKQSGLQYTDNTKISDLFSRFVVEHSAQTLANQNVYR